MPVEMFNYAESKLEHNISLYGYENNSPDTFGINPVLVAAYGDMMYAHAIAPERKILMMEHGTGHTFGKSAYPNGVGKRDYVSLFLSPNQYTVDKIHTVRDTRAEVIGTPKLDWVHERMNPYHLIKQTHDNPPIIAIGFHWGHARTRPPESGSAFEHYREYIPTLVKNTGYKFLAYGHPLAELKYKEFYTGLDIDYTSDFNTVMRQADVCVNDLSSVMYEFVTTGKPVIVLNAPWFRRDVEHGIRFWDYSDIGINVDGPDELLPAIEDTIEGYEYIHAPQRRKAIRELFPYFGCSANKAVEVIVDYLKEVDAEQHL